MLFQIHQVQRHQALVDNLEVSRQITHQIVTQSQSKKNKNKESLRSKFEAILKQSALLLHIFKQIQQGVKHRNLLPIIFHSKDLNELLYNRSNLPEWFQDVFQKQYQKEKANLQTLGLKIYKLHGLSQKNAVLTKQHWNLQILLERYQSLNQKQLEAVDIIEEVKAFKTICRSCKQVNRNFLDMMVRKVLSFLQNIVQSTLIYSGQLKKARSLEKQTLDVNKRQRTLLQTPQTLANKNLVYKNTRNIANRIQNRYVSDYQDLKAQVKKKGNLNQTVHKINNCPTVESLRLRQKANNQFFYRKASSKDHSRENSLTKQINAYKKYRQRNQTINQNSPRRYFQQADKSRDHSASSPRIQYNRHNSLKNYYSNSNLNTYPQQRSIHNSNSINQTRVKIHQKDHSRNSLKQDKQNDQILRSKEHKQCLHHCPHHDKYLGSHCSKHCNKICSHEKDYYNNFRIDLSKMNRQFYESKVRAKIDSVKSARSIAQAHNLYLGKNTGLTSNNRSRGRIQQNVTQKGYLRNSHDRHQDYISSNYHGQPVKQRAIIAQNRTINQQTYIMSKGKTYNNLLQQTPNVRQSQYYV